jgi:hypothetical protein
VRLTGLANKAQYFAALQRSESEDSARYEIWKQQEKEGHDVCWCDAFLVKPLTFRPIPFWDKCRE